MPGGTVTESTNTFTWDNSGELASHASVYTTTLSNGQWFMTNWTTTNLNTGETNTVTDRPGHESQRAKGRADPSSLSKLRESGKAVRDECKRREKNKAPAKT